MDRPNDILIPPDTGWLRDPQAQAVCSSIRSGGHTVYFVGGCVRNALLGLPDSDTDMATDAPPDEVVQLVARAGLKSVPTGIGHGTVTVVAGGRGYEVTTFRRDVETDGRRAVVAYTTDVSEDARRRDFTMNALYATPEGVVVDPLGGLADLFARRVRFIEDAQARIREDYLRILRFFRFQAWYADPQDGMDVDALDAITRNIGGLKTLSAERVGAEISKLLSAPDPVAAVAAMYRTGVLPLVLPGSDPVLLGPVVHLANSLGRPADCMLRLAALGGDAVAERLRLSRADARVLEDIRSAAWDGACLGEIAYRSGERVATGALVLRSALAGRPVSPDDLEAVAKGLRSVFPVTARDLMPELSGKALGERLGQLERRWIDSGFRLSRRDLIGPA